jgi:hypothetical protein
MKENLKRLVNNPKFSDIQFLIVENSQGGEKEPQRHIVHAHKQVLAARSPVFAAMFYSHFAESGEHQIQVSDISYDAFMVLMQCMYTDNCALNNNILIEVLFVAKKYQFLRLVKKCVQYMREGITTENAIKLFANTPNLIEEEQVILHFIEDHATECLQTPDFYNLSAENMKTIISSNHLAINEPDLFRNLIKWGETQLKLRGKSSQADSLKQELSPYLGLVRFGLFDIESFAQLVPSTSLLEPADLLYLFSFLGKRKDEALAASKAAAGPALSDFNCSACTFLNKAGSSKCTLCGAPAPEPGQQIVLTDWNCPGKQKKLRSDEHYLY